jgi:hypothetical protein
VRYVVFTQFHQLRVLIAHPVFVHQLSQQCQQHLICRTLLILFLKVLIEYEKPFEEGLGVVGGEVEGGGVRVEVLRVGLEEVGLRVVEKLLQFEVVDRVRSPLFLLLGGQAGTSLAFSIWRCIAIQFSSKWGSLLRKGNSSPRTGASCR